MKSKINLLSSIVSAMGIGYNAAKPSIEFTWMAFFILMLAANLGFLLFYNKNKKVTVADKPKKEEE